jgi:hypothetical protein
VLLVYDRHNYSDHSPFYYWCTNPIIDHQVDDRYFNTKLKQDEEWNEDDALINKEAAYKDGWYRIWALAYDIEGNGGDTTLRKGADFVDVLFDNYVPFVDEVTVKKGEEVKYNGKWTLNGSGMDFNIPTDDSISTGDIIHIVISFSEVMGSDATVTLEKDEQVINTENGKLNEDKTSWEGDATIPDDEDAKGEWTILISSRDLASHTLDVEPSSIGKRNEEGDWEGYDVGDWDKNHKIHVGVPPPPRVIYTDPSKGASDVLIDQSPITVTFSKPMDETVTDEAIKSVSPSFEYDISWKDEKTLELELTNTLEYCTDYTITVSDTLTDTAGIHLDGDKDGKPRGDYVFTFTTEKPPITVSVYPVVAHVDEGQSVDHHVVTSGATLKEDVNCNIHFDVNNPGGWSVSGASDQNFSLAPAGSFDKTYSVSNNGATASLDVLYQVGAECSSKNGEGYYWSAQGHMRDHPDENQSPGIAQYPTPWIISTEGTSGSPLDGTNQPPSGLPDIGILLSGWADGYGHILGKYGISTLPIKPDLTKMFTTEVEEFRVLCFGFRVV